MLAFSETLATVLADLNLLSNFSNSDWEKPWVWAIFNKSNSLNPWAVALLNNKSNWLELSSEKFTLERSEKLWEYVLNEKIKHTKKMQYNLKKFNILKLLKTKILKNCLNNLFKYFYILKIKLIFNIIT